MVSLLQKAPIGWSKLFCTMIGASPDICIIDLRRWPNNKTTVGQRFVLAGSTAVILFVKCGI